MNTRPLLTDTVELQGQPHPLLRPFVSRYVFRSIRIPKDCYLKKAMPLRTGCSLDFFIGDAFETSDCRTGQTVPFERCTIRGLRTKRLYFIKLNGHFVSFTIKFSPTGLYDLTGIPAHHFTDRSVPGDLVDNMPLVRMTKELLPAHDLRTCINIAESHLLPLAEKRQFQRQYQSFVAEQASLQLASPEAPFSMRRLAEESHLSLRQLERTFLKEVGVSPKTLYRMHRFERLIRSKMDTPLLKWSAMAYEFGYYDQRHLIRDFRQFLDVSPSSFVPSHFAF